VSCATNRAAIRRAEAVGLREHLEELPAGALDQLEAPDVYAQEYRAHRDLRTRRVVGALRRTSVGARVAIVVVVVVIAAAATVPTWVAHYQPISVDVFLTSPGSLPQHNEHNDLVLSYRDNAHLVLGMTIRNSGRFDASLTGYERRPTRWRAQVRRHSRSEREAVLRVGAGASRALPAADSVTHERDDHARAATHEL